VTIKLATEKLTTALSVIEPGILTRKSLVEQYSDFVFLKDSIMTFNEKVAVKYPLETGFEFLVKSKEFYSALSSFTSKEIEMTLADKKVNVKGKGERFEMAVSIDVKHIDTVKSIFDTVEKVKWKKVPEKFIEGLSLCSFSISDSFTFHNLSCACVNEEGIVTSDNIRVSFFKLPGFESQFLLPKSSTEDILQFPISEYFLTDTWVFFKTKDNVIIALRTVLGDYPDITSVFDIEGDSIELPEELKKVVSEITVFSDTERPEEQKIEIFIGNKLVTCRDESASGWFEKDIPSKSRLNRRISFKINPSFLLAILNKTSTMILSEDKALFKTDNFSHIMILPE